jgi:Ca2+-binding EF-hand superfamily protein
MGLPIQRKQVEWLVSEFDLNKNGHIDYEEFFKMLIRLRGDRETYSTGLNWTRSKKLSSVRNNEELERNRRLVAEQYMNEHVGTKEKSFANLDMKTEQDFRYAAKAIALDLLKAEDSGRANHIKDIFNEWDKDGNNIIDIHEFMEGLKSIGYNFSNQVGIGIFSIFDIKKDMKIHYWEFVRVLHELAHADISPARKQPENERQDTEREISDDKDQQQKSSANPAATNKNSSCKDSAHTDNEVLRMIEARIQDKKLSAHTLIRKLVPECSNGNLDIDGLDRLFSQLGFKLSKERLNRLMERADVAHTGKLASWELVRLLSEASHND